MKTIIQTPKWDIGKADDWGGALLLAKDGWELVNVCCSVFIGSSITTYYFKRRRID